MVLFYDYYFEWLEGAESIYNSIQGSILVKYMNSSNCLQEFVVR